VSLLGLLLLAACVGRGAAHPEELRHERLSVGKVERQYFVYAPPDLPKGPHPLVFVFHGGGGSAAQVARAVGDAFHALADRDGFVVVYPDAINKMWDFGSGKVSEALDPRVEDRAYFEALLGELPRRFEVDPQRVFATGISRGGQASYFMACSFPGRLRAIAPVAMSLPRFMLDACRDAAPTGVAILNGTEDPVVPYDGGEIRVGRRQRGQVLSTDETVAFWRERNDCDFEATDEEHFDAARDGTSVHLRAWKRCRYAPVLLYRIEGGGHTWPAGKAFLPRFVVGRTSQDIDATAEIWSFFQSFR